MNAFIRKCSRLGRSSSPDYSNWLPILPSGQFRITSRVLVIHNTKYSHEMAVIWVSWYMVHNFFFPGSRGLAQKNHWSASNIQGKPRKQYALVNILSKRGLVLCLWEGTQLNQHTKQKNSWNKLKLNTFEVCKIPYIFMTGAVISI